jgi:L,D-transpeptidase ErfK/SrfK
MPVKLKDDSIACSMMLLCLGTAGLLALTQWQMMAGRFDVDSSQRAALLDGERSQQPLAVMKQSISPDPQTTANPTITPLEAKPETVAKTNVRTNVRVVVSLNERQVQVYQGGQLLDSYAIAVAKPGWETPTGTFQVLEMETNPTWVHPITGIAVPPGSDNPLGVAWIGFLSNEAGEIGFHGTNQEELIGEAVSHGCLRMRNEDVKALYSQIAMGTPVIVEQ